MVTAQELMAQVNNTLKTSAVRMGSDPQYKVSYIPTGVMPIDQLLGGGLPRGRMVECYGDFSTLKSFIGLQAIAGVQRAGGTAALIDTEHTFDPAWAASLGVDTDNLILWPDRTKINPDSPPTGEMAMDVAQTLAYGGLDILVFDSIAAVLPQSEHEKRLSGEKTQPGRLAQLMSKALRKLTTANSKTAFFWVNQTRMDIGITFGNPEQPTGGRAMAYYASMRLKVRKAGVITHNEQKWDGEKMVDSKVTDGQKFVASLEKSKLSKPTGQEHFIWSLVNNSIDEEGYLIARGLELGIITYKGAAWQFAEHKAHGKDKFKELVVTDAKVRTQLEKAVLTPSKAVATTASTSPGNRPLPKKRVVRAKPAS
jgi:recombination protein RecA